MKNHELLAPAGNMECLYQAVFNGCDAVYIAGQRFGARKFASNFSDEELIEAINFCHLYGVRVYVTMNTLIMNSEVDDFLDTIRFLHKNHVDAVIMQDFGMICLVREMFPNLEIHASTQANNTSKKTIELFYKLGVKRVVFSRELSIDEIDSIDVPIEKEAFIHGALCISYSGRCLMSSMLGGRSGNRGECAGTCRMPYSLYHDNKLISKDKYLLSTKELNTSSQFDRLMRSSIYSFKIEGRMKGPLYVGFITNFYRKLIDGEEIDFKDYTDKLKTIFNREFTEGHLFNNNDKSIINDSSPNHIGLRIGKAEVYKNKIKITLDKGMSLKQYDAIRFLNSKTGMIVNYLYDKKDNLCSFNDSICYVDNKDMITSTDIVCKTQDSSLDSIYIRKDPIRRVKVNYFVYAHVGEELRIEINDGVNNVSLGGKIVQKSINAPITKENIYRSLSRLNDSCYEIDNITYDIDEEIFISVGELNELRRGIVSELNQKRININNNFIEKKIEFSKINECNSGLLTCSVYNEEQLITCLNIFDRIFVRDINLYNKYSNYNNVYYFNKSCVFDEEFKMNGLVSDLFDFSDGFYGNYELNVTNIYTAYYLIKMNLKSIFLSVELSRDEIVEFIDLFNKKFGKYDFEVLVYGRIQNMIIKGNILEIESDDYKYKLNDTKKRSFPVYYDGDKTHILNYENRELMLYIGCSKRFDFYDESCDYIKNIVNDFK